MVFLAERIGDAPRPQAARRVLGDADRVVSWYEALGRGIARRRSPPAPVEPDPEMRPAMLAGIRQAQASRSRENVVASTTIVWGALHLELLERLAGECAQAAAKLG
jgi:hypothetical protein